MLLNYIFIGFFLVGLVAGGIHLCLTGDWSVFTEMTNATFSQSKNGFEISLYLTGVLCLWLGLMKIAERSGLIAKLSRRAAPVLSCLFPSVPREHPAMGNIFMNITANLLGLDNAATPLGIQAMERLQELNPEKERASDAMIMFLAINASGLTLIPSSIMAFRLQAGAANPADIFIPVLIATFVSTLTAILIVGIRQRINFLRLPLLIFLTVSFLFIGSLVYVSQTMPAESLSRLSSSLSAGLLFGLIIIFLLSGMRARINVYEAFIDGAKEGFRTAVGIIPYLIAILVGVGVFRASGAMGLLCEGFRFSAEALGMDSRFADALPTMLMKPLSGSGARGMMVDTMQTFGADSFVGRLACTVQGCSDTTFYVLAVYFGAVGIKRTRYTAGASLAADLAGAVAAVLVTYMFFG